MEAIDTVMSDQQLDGISVTKEEVNAVIESGCFDGTDKSIAVQEVTALTIVFNRKVAKAQAEITFPKGIDKGRKEVWEWVLAHKETSLFNKHGNVYIDPEEAEVKLKEWGLLRQEMPK